MTPKAQATEKNQSSSKLKTFVQRASSGYKMERKLYLFVTK